MEKLKELKKNYEDLEIPKELDLVVNNTIKENKVNMKNKKRITRWAVALASAFTIIISINLNPNIANAMSDIPFVGKIVKVFNFRTYTLNEDTYNANIEVPAIEGLENTELQNALNNKYLEENKRLYEDFVKEVEEIKDIGGAHLGIDSGYIIKTDNDDILSIGRYIVNTAASSSTVMKYDTVDKVNEVLITLPSLFKDDSYIKIISENILSQMKEQMLEDENKIYWIDDEGFESFKEIDPNANFYINEDYQLVISFNKYDVAPGYMGVIEFIIPSEVISECLVGNNYIK